MKKIRVFKASSYLLISMGLLLSIQAQADYLLTVHNRSNISISYSAAGLIPWCAVGKKIAPSHNDYTYVKHSWACPTSLLVTVQKYPSEIAICVNGIKFNRDRILTVTGNDNSYTCKWN